MQDEMQSRFQYEYDDEVDEGETSNAMNVE